MPDIKVTRPEIYFGELTNTDVYVKTRQKEFNYPQGETNSLTSYEGTGGIALGGFFRRLLIALDRGDLAKLPFSDDVTADSRLLMRRNIRERVETLAPFLTFDADPYIVVGDDGRLSWMMDAFTTSDTYPYARHYRLGRERVNYMRNSVKVGRSTPTTARRRSTSFDNEDPIIAAYRALFPDACSRTRRRCRPTLRKHVRYPELLLQLQAAVYGLYHMTDPGRVLQPRGSVDRRHRGRPERAARAGRADDGAELRADEAAGRAGARVRRDPAVHAGQPEQPDRLDCRPQRRAALRHGGRLQLPEDAGWSTARCRSRRASIRTRSSPASCRCGTSRDRTCVRGGLIVIPVGRALLYAEPIYLQAERSPMPELRLVVLALQDRLAYGPTFEAALAALFGNAPSTLATAPADAGDAPAAPVRGPRRRRHRARQPHRHRGDANALIQGAARDLADYQRLTAEGKLGEAGQKLEALKQKLERLQPPRHAEDTEERLFVSDVPHAVLRGENYCSTRSANVIT